jgi:cysteine sulfinate desulfinase/cysteine desulfurase-like protein
MKIVGTSVTLEMIYDEVKKMNERLEHIEDVIEEVVIKSIPEVELSKEKTEEIEHSIQDMKKGNYVTLEELKRSA